ADQLGEAVARGYRIANSDPPGPVYLTLPREVLMDAVEDGAVPGPTQAPPVRLGAGDPRALEDVAQRLIAAERPLVLTGTSGRSQAGFDGLVQLAELLALPVVEWRERVNFPADHPLHLGFDPAPLLESADVVLILDQDVPYFPKLAKPAVDAALIQIDVDPIKEAIPLWSFPLTLP